LNYVLGLFKFLPGQKHYKGGLNYVLGLFKIFAS